MDELQFLSLGEVNILLLYGYVMRERGFGLVQL